MKYHPDIELLLRYSSGQLEPALAVAIGLHQQQCKFCQSRISDLESVGGTTLELHTESQVDVSGFDRLMAEIETVPTDTAESSYDDLAVASVDQALVETLDTQKFDEMNWEKVTRNISRATIAMNDPSYEVELLKFSPNAKIPKHTHQGREFTLVLQGDFSDHKDNYQRGEFIEQDDCDEHQPVAGNDGCICLAITDAPLKFTGTFGPILNWMTK